MIYIFKKLYLITTNKLCYTATIHTSDLSVEVVSDVSILAAFADVHY